MQFFTFDNNPNYNSTPIKRNKVDDSLQPINFNIDILMNKHLLKSFYKKAKISKDETLEEKREIWLKEKIYKIKEALLYNNLNPKYLCNFSNSNIYCK